MSKLRRSFTPEDCYPIVQEAIRDGYSETCLKYIGTDFHGLYKRWRIIFIIFLTTMDYRADPVN